MTEVEISYDDQGLISCDALIVGLWTDAGGVTAGQFQELAPAFSALGADGRLGQVTVLPGFEGGPVKIVGVGLGPQERIGADGVRQAAAIAARAVAGCGHVVSNLGQLDLGAAVEGHLLGGYTFTRYRKAAKAPTTKLTLQLDHRSESAGQELQRAIITAEAVLLARDLVNTAPNDLPPMAFASSAAAAAMEAGLEVSILDEQGLREGGYGGILGVGGGSARPPCLVRIAYRPALANTSVALVGKGITFDSGGISIKSAAGMDHMTSDMAGGAAVVAVVLGAARLQLDVAVTALVPLAENMPSGTAYRPGDVLTQFGGRTTHILNTDCEGRVVLADAIVAAAQDNPDYLIDVATLTYSQMVGLGPRTMGVMGTDDFRDQVAALARSVGEDGWAMPMPDYLREQLDSPLADIANDAGDRSGGMMIAAHFLREFVPDGLPWVHLDIAGPAYNPSKPYGYQTYGGTGVPVRTLLAVLQELA